METRARALVIGLIGFAVVEFHTATAAASEKPALNRVARSIGRALDRNNRSNVRIERGSSPRSELGQRIETALVEALKSAGKVTSIDDDAKFGLKIEYRTDGERICLEVTMLDNGNHSLGKYVANFSFKE